MKKITKITESELVAAREVKADADSMPNSVYAAKKLKHDNANKKVYIDKLTDKEIENFFNTLGYLYHVRREGSDNNAFNEPQIIVVCGNYTIMFNDFTTLVHEENILYPEMNEMGVPTSKEIKELNEYTEITNTPIGKLIADSIAVDLLGKRFSETYPQKKKAFDEANLKAAFKSLSANQKKFFASAREIQQANITSRFNMNAYGKANLEDELRNN